MPLCLIGVSRGFFQTKTIEGTGFNSLRPLSASSVKCSGNLWGCAVQNSSDSKSQMHSGVHVPCTAQRHSSFQTEGLRFKFDPLCVTVPAS